MFFPHAHATAVIMTQGFQHLNSIIIPAQDIKEQAENMNALN